MAPCLRQAGARITLAHMEQTRKARPRGTQTAVTISARLYAGEHAALEQLLTARAAEMEAAHLVPDASFVGWLRAMIRSEAAKRGIVIPPMYQATTTSAPKRAKRAPR